MQASLTFGLLILFATGCASTPKPVAIKSHSAPKVSGPYSHAVKVNNIVFLSGQLGINPETNLAEDGIQQQTKQVMENLKAVLKEADLDFSSVVKTTIYLKNIDDFKQVNEVYAAYFKTGVLPARSTVEVSRFPKNYLIEIEMIAVKADEN